ncbi:Flp pilus assembly protein TadG [Sphingomonas insulae]|uniref:Putative Flp pilus-assembly TadG-like N-terminal domain-containing protein n=1 Tax=Sphingomonas insulae TaxID=424800 RepID=A0ABN1HQD0_9SPHN|nr:pilus assembly protein TadG-related protein [Sphingomonas insulae]NIJ29419.1 Flp pilus assembly protein TadG [Sphingomonas insulae]
MTFLTAIFTIVLLAVVGSAVDLGRAHATRTRLQHACDAASLAGRRAMTTSSVDDTVRAEALKFFNFNFPQGAFGTSTFTPSVSSLSGSTQTVVISAATTSPTLMMKFFGFSAIPLSVTCNAKQDFVNTDIVLVLDTTGSMAAKASSRDTSTKIVALRAAVLALYDQLATVQTNLEAAGMRLRYGIVPYASTVNVGAAIKAVSPNYMYQGQWAYQSRQVVTDNTGYYACLDQYGTYNNNKCTYFKYSARSFDTTNFVSGANVDVAPLVGTGTYYGLTPTTQVSNKTSWKGCIEERQTTQMPASSTSIPTGAYDLDIDLIPATDAQKWKPYWPEVEYTSYQDRIYSSDYMKPQYACPTAAAPMKAWTRANLSDYLDTLDPDGGTYHDFGMMWGARWASANGIFGSANPATYNSMPVKKYIIFMTDGLFDTGYSTLYSGYGVEQLDARVTPGGSSSNEADQLARHKQRFNLLCSKAKTMGYSVWVIGFATTLDASLTNCASNASQASTSANSAALLAKFVEIGKNIGALRLTQ